LSELYVYDGLGGHAGYTVWPPFPERLIMQVLAILLLWWGCAGNPSEHVPVDTTGRTSIIVEFENGDWVELRGPGRFEALELFGEVIE
jgi:hypothetical protein